MLGLCALALSGLSLTACAAHSAQAPQAAKARRIAADVFGMQLQQLDDVPGVEVRDLPGGNRGCPFSCPTTYVRVPTSAAVGTLSFDALMARLQAQGWTLVRSQDTASSCTSGTQSLPCAFSRGTSEGTVLVTPGDAGSYRVTTAAEAS